jgi:hypothetical protein
VYSFESIGLLLLYIVLNIGYSWGLKNLPIIDVTILASGYVIRVFFGALIIGINVSIWLYLVIIMGAYYLGLGKRRNEIGGNEQETRTVLRFYSHNFLAGVHSGMGTVGRAGELGNLGKSGLRVRAVRIAHDGGETETLITNVGEGKIEYEGCVELYHKRWGIETKYQTVKQRMELENFSGRLVDTIKQDFYAMMTVANIMAHFMLRKLK